RKRRRLADLAMMISSLRPAHVDRRVRPPDPRLWSAELARFAYRCKAARPRGAHRPDHDTQYVLRPRRVGDIQKRLQINEPRQGFGVLISKLPPLRGAISPAFACFASYGRVEVRRSAERVGGPATASPQGKAPCAGLARRRNTPRYCALRLPTGDELGTIPYRRNDRHRRPQHR